MFKPVCFTFIILASYAAQVIDCFVPLQVIDTVVEKIDQGSTKIDFGILGKSYTHDELIKRGIIRSLARYFYDQSGGSTKINLNNMDRYLSDVDNLYSDYYGVTGFLHSVDFKAVLKAEFQPIVASVDFASDTEDLPYAHFDAEKFTESNQRVINYTSRINTTLAASSPDYTLARKLTAQVLHTIQDFYSHSNWVEMGKTEINSAIGTKDFNKLLIASSTDSNECMSNCELVQIQCSDAINDLVTVAKELDADFTLSCPVQFYKCKSNLGMLNKLVSGFYTDQKLADGTVIVNPGTLKKCNHGGILDKNSYSIQAVGGINKDSAIYLISPHAHLHSAAALLAELHTEAFFNAIRKQIGDKKFKKFVDI